MSGSDEPEPSSVTVAPSMTVWSAPALATGALLGTASVLRTVTVTVSTAGWMRLSVTVRRNWSAVSEADSGAVKCVWLDVDVAPGKLLPERCTVGPEI